MGSRRPRKRYSIYEIYVYVYIYIYTYIYTGRSIGRGRRNLFVADGFSRGGRGEVEGRKRKRRNARRGQVKWVGEGGSVDKYNAKT